MAFGLRCSIFEPLQYIKHFLTVTKTLFIEGWVYPKGFCTLRGKLQGNLSFCSSVFSSTKWKWFVDLKNCRDDSRVLRLGLLRLQVQATSLRRLEHFDDASGTTKILIIILSNLRWTVGIRKLNMLGIGMVKVCLIADWDRPIRPKPDDRINKNHMTKHFWPYDQINVC